jgi:hypothetical protein
MGWSPSGYLDYKLDAISCKKFFVEKVQGGAVLAGDISGPSPGVSPS